MASTNAPLAAAPARRPFEDTAEYHAHRPRSGGWADHLALAAIGRTSHVLPRLAKLVSCRDGGIGSAPYGEFIAATMRDTAPCWIFPIRYSEKMQWRKLFDLNPLYAVLCDKLAVRDVVSERVGPEYLVPLLWVGSPDDIPFETLEPPYIIKSTHGTGQTLIVKDKVGLDERAVRETARAWLDQCHGTALDELGYVHVPHRLVVEKLLLRADGSPPLERNLCLRWNRKGRAKHDRVDEGSDTFGSDHDMDLTELPWTITNPCPSDQSIPLVISTK